MTAPDLLPCPFCGKNDDCAPKDATRFSGVWRIIHRCKVLGPISMESFSRETLVSAWNTRATPDAMTPEVRADAYEKGLRDALGLIASIGYGKNEDVDAGHEEAFRAIEKHLTDWKAAALAQETPHDRA